jgi:amino acid transporter
MVGKVQRLLLGRPLRSVEAQDERLSQSRALGAFGLDALSSVAYGPNEILYVLILAGAAGTRFSLPVALAITALLAIVITSYRQTLFAYPNGGGSYTVARENLGTQAGLLAAAALMVDYLATVAVSVTAGVEAVVALAPGLDPYRVPLDVGCIVVIMLVNLRGVREAGAVFVLPTYVFLGSLAVLLGWGLLRLVTGDLPHLHAQPLHATEGVTLFLLLRAFAGGCTAMTGVEAIANGVPMFEDPEPRNAARTLTTLGVLLGVLVVGVTGLGNAIGAVPSDQAGVIAQIGHAVAGGGPLFWLVQLSTALILLLAANTPFNGFPLLAAIMAQDWYLPRQFVHRGLRLSYSNGILVIGTLAIGLVVLFGGSTHALIPLYAVGVFLCFTLSQAGMVRHWLRVRGRGWRPKLAINGLGALTTGLVTAIVVIVKFPEGAWLITLIVPALMVLFVRIHRYYMQAGEEVRVWRVRPPERQRCRHTVLVPIAGLNRPAVESLVYACSISERVTAVHICQSDEEKARFRKQWAEWGTRVPLVEIHSPYRLIVEPLLDYIDELNRQEPGELLTVVLPELVPMHWWANALHNQVALRLKLALFTRPGTVVTSVPYHLQC